MPDSANARISLRPHQLAAAALPLALALVWVYLALQLIFVSSNFLVLMCAAGLVAIMLNRVALGAEKHLGLPRKIGVVILLALIVGGVVAGAYIAGAQLVQQYAELGQTLPKAAQTLRDNLLSGPFGSYLKPVLSQPNGGLNPSRALGSFSNWLSTAVGVVSSLFFFLAVTLYMSVQPELYVRGFLTLLKTEERKARAREVLHQLYDRLWKFLLAAFLEMSIVGVVTTVGLWALDIPYALALGLTAGLLCFIPVLGPALSFIPALLVGLAQGTDAALEVTILFAVIQLIESNLITPLIQKKLADVPPVLLLLGQAVAGLLFGLLGIALAAPSIVVLMVLVEQFHLRPSQEAASEVAVAEIEAEPARGKPAKATPAALPHPSSRPPSSPFATPTG